MIPKNIGRYEVKSELGRGGMATVFCAHDPSFDRDVAVKVLPREFLHDPQFRGRFEREIKTVAQLEHPAIVPVYDVGEDDGQPFFVMRQMTGGSLSDWLKQGAFSLQDTARIVERLAKALTYAHKKGIVHRDLKPGNVLFDNNGEPFITDFGVAKLVESASNMTGSGIVGTPAYMSPEQAQSGKVDSRSDIYGMGVIIYEMLTGSQPYKADTPMSVVIKHITDPVPEILRDRPDLPPEVDAVIKQAMDKDPEKRYPTMIDLAKALNKAAFGEEGHITDSQIIGSRLTTVGAPAVGGINRMGVIIAAGAAVVVLVVAGVILLNGRPATGPATEVNQTAAPTATVEPTPTEEIIVAPTLPGNADKIALISNKEIWLTNMDGSEAFPFTNDGTDKAHLQWLADGQSLVYVNDKCAYRFDTQSKQAEWITCFRDSKYFEGFRVSPDGKRVAISLNRELIIVPFDIPALNAAKNRGDLLAMGDACYYNQAAVKELRWSRDGTKLAAIFLDPDARLSDAIRVMDVSHCPDSNPVRLDDFPAGRFTLTGYKNNLTMPSFDWDGGDLFLLNDSMRKGGYGNLYLYNMQTHEGRQINPMQGTCCYRDARWSPDGKYVLFMYQDAEAGDQAQNQLYYVPYEALSTGEFGEPIPLPLELAVDLQAAPLFELRPAQ
jgi:predicted Ser/Thr protein kinase